MKTLHESDDQLELYALDRLSEEAVERVEEHLIVCEPCRMRLEDIGAFALSMRKTLRTEPELVIPRRLGWFEGWHVRLAFGGAVAFAALLGFVATQNSQKVALPPVAALTLTAMRGAVPTVHPAKQLELELTGAEGDGMTVEVVDATGQLVWQGTPAVGNSMARVAVAKQLAAGSYFVRLKKPSGELLHEYGFDVRP